MNPEKVGKFIKKIRKDNNLTQKELGDKYHVTYQAVSKWENGINLPEVSLIRQMSKDFNISVEDILDGELTQNKNKKRNWLLFVFISLIIISLVTIILFKDNNNSFEFKTISSTCEDFKVTGSLAYDKEKSSIYISQINYCGGDDTAKYKEIECNLYEKNDGIIKQISTCKKEGNNILLEDYLKDVTLNIDNYSKECKRYTNESLYLEVNAKDDNNKITTYKIPLNLNNNCSN